MINTTAAAIAAAEAAAARWFVYYAPTSPHSPSIGEAGAPIHTAVHAAPVAHLLPAPP